ncbi:hypothetical protein [Clostridium sp. BSD2780061688st1 E8]|nr:hypothetical protein [Clostridium sp. BSD2780061688st1 E8]
MMIVCSQRRYFIPGELNKSRVQMAILPGKYAKLSVGKKEEDND